MIGRWPSSRPGLAARIVGTALGVGTIVRTLALGTVIRILARAIFVGAVLVACSSGTAATSPDERRLPVLATTTILADIVRNVGGACVSVDSIVPAGVGPEDYEPRPDDVRRIADARLLVSNGLGLDDFLDRLLAANAGPAGQLVLADGIPTITVDGEPNPHFWLDPSLVRRYFVPAIEAKLASLAPACAGPIADAARAYEEQLDDLDRELLAKVATIPPANRKLVSFHDAFPYFARHFGFELVGIIVPNVGQEPSASDLAALVDRIRAAGVRAVFSEAQFDPKLARTLADEAGVTTVVSDILTDALGPNGGTYLELMRWDVGRVAAALGGSN